MAWYTSGSTYVTVSFKGLKEIARISINQLDTANYSQFTAFRISYSTDGAGYIDLPEKKLRVISQDPIIYYMPRIVIKCRYLRIHITNVTVDTLSNKTSGLKVNEIYGRNSNEDLTMLSES